MDLNPVQFLITRCQLVACRGPTLSRSQNVTRRCCVFLCRELRKSMLLQLGGEHSHEVKHSNETHHNANALEKNHGHATGTLETHHGHKAGTLDTHHGHTTGALDTHHGHKTGTLETHHVHTTVEVRSESLDHGHGKAVKVSLHREGSDDSGERSPGSPTPGRLALVGDWERKITRSSSP